MKVLNNYWKQNNRNKIEPSRILANYKQFFFLNLSLKDLKVVNVLN